LKTSWLPVFFMFAVSETCDTAGAEVCAATNPNARSFKTGDFHLQPWTRIGALNPVGQTRRFASPTLRFMVSGKEFTHCRRLAPVNARNRLRAALTALAIIFARG
jgi:hypothetical protein